MAYASAWVEPYIIREFEGSRRVGKPGLAKQLPPLRVVVSV